jgi:hypothetical protein
MKALEKRPAHRHQSAAELQHELQEFLDGAGLKSGSRRLAQYMKELFGVVDPGARGAAGSNGTPAVLGGASAPGPRSTADDELEELDFDRRAPLVMRVVPRPEPVDDPSAQGSLGPPLRAATALAPPAAAPLDPAAAETEARDSEKSLAGARVDDDPGAIATPEALTHEEAAAASGRLSIWVVLLVLVATGIVVFLGTRW